MAACVIAAAVWLISATPALAAAPHRRDSADSQQAAADVEAMRATAEQLTRSLDEMEAAVSSAEQRLADARSLREKAAQQLRAVRAEEKRAAAQVTRVKHEARDLAVSAYIRGPAVAASAILDASSAPDAARRAAVVARIVEGRVKVLDELRLARRRLTEQRTAAAKAATTAEAAAVAAEQGVSEARAARARHAALVSAVHERIDRALAEAAAVAAIDEQLADEVSQPGLDLARRVPPPRASRGAPRPGAVPTSWVGGIQVNTTIADRVAALVEAARRDGVLLGGSGYRDPAHQIAIRVQNCGPSDYEVYEMPASECSPPTARPGTSLHERGLAVDFTAGGSAITSEAHPAFQWLAANAEAFGVENLPGEAWHWSTTGS